MQNPKNNFEKKHTQKSTSTKTDTQNLSIIRIAILFSGNGSNLENIVRYFSKTDTKNAQKSSQAKSIRVKFPIAICNKKEAYGITRCQNLGIKYRILPHTDFANRIDFDRALADILRDESIDLVVLAGFMRILGSEFVREFQVINIHPSFLPLHKGANAIKDSYDSSEDFGGVSVHWVSEELDAGEIILQEKLPKIVGESLESFESRIHALEYALYPKALQKVLFSKSLARNP